MTFVLALLVGLALSGPGICGPFEEGLTAYDQGQFDTAFKLWLALAEQGHAAAQFNVAVMYEKGSGIGQDSAAAARWYLAAGKQGAADAQYKVGLLYETGSGLAKDPIEARKWYAAVLANTRTDNAAATAKEQARQRLANMTDATEEVIPYLGGWFVIVRSRDGVCVIALQGPITKDARWKFDAVVARTSQLGCGKPSLMLESSGGALLDGLSLGREVRSQGFRTMTRYECASACALIFLGGTERVLVGSRARIGLHQAASMNARTLESRCSTSMDSNGVREMRRYVMWAVPATADQVIEQIMQTSCKAISWINGQQALDLGIATNLEAEDVDLFGPKSRKR